MKITDLKIGQRLALLSGMLLLSTVAVGLEAWSKLGDGESEARNALNKAGTYQLAVDTARTSQVNFKIQVQAWKDILLRGGDPAAFEKYRAEFDKKSNETQDKLRELKNIFIKLGLDASEIDATINAHADLREKYLAALGQFDASNSDSAHIVDKLVKGIDRPPTQKIDDIVNYITVQSDKERASAEAATRKNYLSACAFLLSAILLAIAIGSAVTYWLVCSITQPLMKAVEFAKRVASGDLTAQIESNSADETGQLLRALKEMNSCLGAIVEKVRTGTDVIASATSQIAVGNLDLSARTEAQASSLEETASSMEEMTSTVRHNADNAKQANVLAMSASDVAHRGGKVMSQVVDTMNSIKESSKKIVDIISVIDSIAFQTNILALNAAVEAARAGVQGRGFAIVASEVRNLAQRSASAAKEIKALIGDSVEKVNAGGKLVDEAEGAIDGVVESVMKLADIVAEISTASAEQSSGIEQINQAILQMDDVTQQNAALVEEAAGAASSMQQQADELTRIVGTFRLDAYTEMAYAGVKKEKTVVAVAVHKLPRPETRRTPTAPVRTAPRISARTGTDDWDEF